MKTTDRLAFLVDLLFHPLIMPFYALAGVFRLHPYLHYSLASEIKNMLLWILFITCVVLPALLTFFLVHKRIIHSLKMKERKERLLPVLITFLMYLVCYFLIRLMPVPELILGIVLSGAALTLIAFLLTLFWKVSIHMMGIGGLAAIIWITGARTLADASPYLGLVLLAAGLTAWARLCSQTHTTGQIYGGFVAGLLTALILLETML
jgi:hypothetical protein